MENNNLRKIIIAGFVILMTSVSVPVHAQQKYDSLNVIHLTDLHICSWEGYSPDLRTKRRLQYADNQADFENFLRTMPLELHADAIMTSGDNIDFFAGEAVDGTLKAGQIENFVEVIGKSSVPVYLTLGNHEISTFYTKSAKDENVLLGGHYNAEKAKAAWIRNSKVFENGTYYSKIIRVGNTDYLFLFLEAIYRIEKNPTDAFWNPEMIEWLNHELEMNPDAIAVMFFHVPLPVPDNNNDGVYLSKPSVARPDKDLYSSGIMKTLNDHKNISALFVGHNHENIIEEMIMPDGRKIPEIETGSFGEGKSNWRLLTFLSDKIKISVPGNIKNEFLIPIKK
ncbi:MAG: metallophosphoesterase [Melioribacteraceae bacterium]